MKKDKAKSKEAAERIGAVPQQCFYNAFHVVSELPEYEDATYVEGIAVHESGVFVGEHGWVAAEGKIVDPTLPDSDLSYFPGLEFEGVEAVQKALVEIPKESPEDFPILWRYGWGGKKSPEILQAWEKAGAFSRRQCRGQE